MSGIRTCGISDPQFYEKSAQFRLCCADLIIKTFEKWRGEAVNQKDRILDLGCGLRTMIDGLWVTGKVARNPTYVLGLDVDYNDKILEDIKKSDSKWKLFSGWNSELGEREFVKTSIIDWTPPSDKEKKFSIVYSGSALHWMTWGFENTMDPCLPPENGKTVFCKVAKALKPGGFFVAHFPGCENFYPGFTRIILATLNNIKNSLETHPSIRVKNLARIPDITEWIESKQTHQNNIEQDESFLHYWEFRRDAKVAFWKNYNAIRHDFAGSELKECLLYRGIDWELTKAEEFYAHWASAGKSVFFSRFQTEYEKKKDGDFCALYNEFEKAFKSILADDDKLEELGICKLNINGERYIRHYCHRYYIILQKPNDNGETATDDIPLSSITSLPIKIADDVATTNIPKFSPGTRDNLDKYGENEKEAHPWSAPFLSIRDIIPSEASMVYGTYLRQGRKGLSYDRRTLFRDYETSPAHQWQLKFDDLDKAKIGISRFTSVDSISKKGLPVCLTVDVTDSLTERICGMAQFVQSQRESLKEATPVFLIASTTNPRIDSANPPADLAEYLQIVNGGTKQEAEGLSSFLFYSSESIYEWLRDLEQWDPCAMEVFRMVRWHATVAFPCAFVLGHTMTGSAKGESGDSHHFDDVSSASASVLLKLQPKTIKDRAGYWGRRISDFSVIGASLRILTMWDQVAAERRLKQYVIDANIHRAQAAIMSRNMSHNLGSHALANSKFMKSVGLLNNSGKDPKEERWVQGVRNRLQSFNQYCQGRLDFIARKISGEDDKPDPLFFVEDVLKGFMTQKVLLDTLLEDNGFTTKNIEFHINLKGNQVVWKYGTNELGVYKKDQTNEFIRCESPDELVGIAGGTTGCHAIYAFIENLLRNAAKYSGRTGLGSGLQLNICLVDYKDVNGENCYLLRFWENLTNDQRENKKTGNEETGGVAATVRKELAGEVINEQGTPNSGGHGLQEMKLCAEYLAGPLAFKNDVCLIRDTPLEHDKLYVKFLKQNLQKKIGKAVHSNNKKVETIYLTSPRLRAFSLNGINSGIAGEHQHALVYEMLIPKPTLLGITCTVKGRSKDCNSCKSTHPSVRCYPSIESMAEGNAHFGLILAHDADKETLDYTLRQKVANNHNALPYRLMVVAEKETILTIWKNEIETQQASINKPFAKTAIPYHRLHAICYKRFFRKDGLASITEKQWEKHIHKIYESWLRVWKGNPARDGQWKLFIGFERNITQISNRWGSLLAGFKADLCQIYIMAKLKAENTTNHQGKQNNGQRRMWLGVSPVNGVSLNGEEVLKTGIFSGSEVDDKLNNISRFIKANKQSALIFDNHSRCFTGLDIMEFDNWPRFYHEFGADQLGMYQMLETPPSSEFGFSFFIYSLVESCLTNIAVLDERVADSTVNKDDFDHDKMKILHRAGIFPLYSFRTEVAGKPGTENAFVSLNIFRCYQKYKENLPKIALSIWQDEGVRFSNDKKVKLLQAIPSMSTCNGNLIELTHERGPDLLIIHEGITDILSEIDCWAQGDHTRLYSLVPAIIRTSGRGRKSRKLGDELPYLELNVLSDSCYGSMNKKKLAYAGLNVSGEPTREQKE